MRILCTGHIGFIGSHFCKYVLKNVPDAYIIGFNRNSSQHNLRRLEMVRLFTECRAPRLQTVWGDLTDTAALSGLCEGIDIVVNLAAKTFVDHSLKDPWPFIQSNIIGTNNLMDEATRQGVKRFVQVSTDEVYGEILQGAYREDAPLNPRNPYSWTKSCGDLNAIWRHRTYGFPVIITRTENNFGFFQHRQKAIPTFVRSALAGDPLPVYGDGGHVRCWLHVDEHCAAIWHLAAGAGQIGEIYHIAGEQELTNLELARSILRTLGKPEDAIRLVPDHNIRPGHDRRYALDCAKLRATGWTIKQNLEERLAETVLWYKDNQEWLA